MSGFNGDTLHAALFDRTVEQRRTHGQYVLNLTREFPEATGDDISGLADMAMEADFYATLNDIAGITAEDAINALGHGNFESFRHDALVQLRVEIGALHAALPLPMLERMASQS